MVIFLFGPGLVDVGRVVGVDGSLEEEVAEPGSGLHLFEDVEVLVADHVGDEEGFDALQGAVGVPPGGEVAGAVERVGVRPLVDRLFAVVEDQPDGVALRRVGAEVRA